MHVSTRLKYLSVQVKRKCDLMAILVCRRCVSLVPPFFVMLIVQSVASVALARTWTDRTQKHKIQGEFASLENGIVCIEREDGKQIRIPLEKLSLFDQDYVARESTKALGRRDSKMPKAEVSPFQLDTDAGNADQSESAGDGVPVGRGSVQAGKANEEVSETEGKAGGAADTVVAEGTGATADEALKDAFRNGVRQAVGSVVDANTLVENDELIEDKILTYSDGFIKSYEKLSEVPRAGLFRVRIRAVVERRTLTQRLQAARIATQEFDGSSVMARATTELESEQDAEALLRNALKDFPESILTARIVGEPQPTKKTAETATAAIQVVVGPDIKAYRAFVDRLTPVLEKLALRKSNFTATFEGREKDTPWVLNLREEVSELFPKSLVERNSATERSGTYADDSESQPFQIAVVTSVTKRSDRFDVRRYLVGGAVRPAMTQILRRKAFCSLTLFDNNGEIVTTDRWPAVVHGPGTTFLELSMVGVCSHFIFKNPGYQLGLGRSENWDDHHYLIMPAFDRGNIHGNYQIAAFSPIRREIELTHEEWASVTKTTVELSYEEEPTDSR
jgi:hypothetical protein